MGIVGDQHNAFQGAVPLLIVLDPCSHHANPFQSIYTITEGPRLFLSESGQHVTMSSLEGFVMAFPICSAAEPPSITLTPIQ